MAFTGASSSSRRALRLVLRRYSQFFSTKNHYHHVSVQLSVVLRFLTPDDTKIGIPSGFPQL